MEIPRHRHESSKSQTPNTHIISPTNPPTVPQTHGIAGHEGAGTVLAAHPSVSHIWAPGDRAGVKWVTSICRHCEFCTNGVDELHCPKQLNSGFSVAGTFQEYCLTDGRYATRIPEGVSDEEAGPIMCGGVTAYTACKRSAVRPGQWVVVLGAGGGLGLVFPSEILLGRVLLMGVLQAFRRPVCQSHGYACNCRRWRRREGEAL